METTFYQSFSSDDLILVGISNTNNQSLINSFIEENSLTFPIILILEALVVSKVVMFMMIIIYQMMAHPILEISLLINQE